MKFKILRLIALAAVLIAPAARGAETPVEPRARLKALRPESRGVVYAPIALDGGSRLTMVSPAAWAPLGRRLGSALTAAHEDYTRLYGAIPALEISIQLMEEEHFFAETGAPRWTNALFFRGRITIPISLKEPLSFDNLLRSVRHEYAHAVINALSGTHCPGWLDEGLAQLAEGSENPALKPALQQWLARNAPVPLSRLQGGYTRLELSVVPAAYAQSLFMTRLMINTFGFKLLRRYFDLLRTTPDRERAFHRAFGLSTREFESQAGAALRVWNTPRQRRLHG